MRANALHQLIQVVQELPDPWLLLGDFNMPAASWIDEQPSWRAYPAPAAPTMPTKAPVEAIDYCVAPGRFYVQAEVLDRPGSGHLPVLVSCRCSA
jgi:endonuclease/exonuclease/phosphatase family metal-dependent hydrolase